MLVSKILTQENTKGNSMEYKHLPKEFQDIVEDTKYEEPKVEIDEDIKNYVEGVINNPSEEQEHLIRTYVENKVKLVLSSWKSRYRQNDEIIENMTNHHKSNEEKIKKLEKDKKDLEKKVRNINSKIYTYEEKIKSLEHISPSKNFNKKFTLYFLLVIAFGLAILSAYKYGVAMNGIAHAFDTGNTAANKSVLPHWVQYILYGLGSFAILALGKIISIAYEKLNYSKKFFMSIVVLALVSGSFSAYYLSKDYSFLNKKATLSAELNQIDTDLENIEPEPGEELADEDKVKKDKLEKRKEALIKKIDSMKDEAIALDGRMLLLVLFTEILVGGVVWMYATDYSIYAKEEDRSHVIETLKKHKQQELSKLENIEAQIRKLEEEIEDLRLQNHDLHRVLSIIKTEDEIEDILKQIIEDKSSLALAYLWKLNEQKG